MAKYNPFEEFLKVLTVSAEKKGLSKQDIISLTAPNKIIQVVFPVRMDDGSEKLFEGYRVQYNNNLGPYKGGIRYHKNTDLNEVKALAGWMSIKCAVAGIPYGGGKGGVKVDKSLLSVNEIERLTRAYCRAIYLDIGQDIDISAPDVNTNPQIMEWFENEYSTLVGKYTPAVVTGKPVEKGGSLGRTEATGRGVVVAVKQALNTHGKSIQGATVAVQGNGNVGGVTVKQLAEKGAKVVALSDNSAAVFAPDGIDVEQTYRMSCEKKQLIDYKAPNARVIADPTAQKQLLTCAADVLVPCALENQIDEEIAPLVQARFVVEGANGPVTTQADEILCQKGVFVVPDILANSGGVVCSYYEWLQNKNNEKWSLEKVNSMVESNLASCYDNVFQYANSNNCTMRQAAYILAIERILKAKKQ